uniref:Uncharacterized protein n=1 Tax=Siphoviridae sp. ctpbb7 TaxID=2826465 RepID=A0A8S5N0J6_9CAUD|nr:MAG TPA: hypothetical protein [Siphoviridae sp. ctpbb7]
MPNVRPLNTKKYGISKHAFATAYSYCLQYREWQTEIADMTTTYRSPQVTGMPTGSGGSSDATADAGMRIAELAGKVALIEDTARLATSGYDAVYPYLLRYVTTEGCTFAMIRQQGVPCGRTLFYELRRKFYYLMAKKI